ncbi:MAG TPA: hypothetical protein VJ801_18280 [Polyangia bacterium]|jgi:hypothetical protein|nr:hypothetical protein [Polyangia bacterium]
MNVVAVAVVDGDHSGHGHVYDHVYVYDCGLPDILWSLTVWLV